MHTAWRNEKDLIWKVVRAREIDGEKIILDKDFFIKNMFLTSQKTYAKALFMNT